MRRIFSFFTGILLSAGIWGLLAMAILRMRAFEAEAGRLFDGFSNIKPFVSADKTIIILIAAALGLVGMLLSYILVLYPTPKKPVQKHPLFILAALYGLGLILSFLIFFIGYQ